jgi:hypothetical protein
MGARACVVSSGGYIVDDTASPQNGFAICMEPVVADEIQADYGVSVEITNPLRPGAAEFADLVAIFQALHVRARVCMCTCVLVCACACVRVCMRRCSFFKRPQARRDGGCALCSVVCVLG